MYISLLWTHYFLTLLCSCYDTEHFPQKPPTSQNNSKGTCAPCWFGELFKKLLWRVICPFFWEWTVLNSFGLLLQLSVYSALPNKRGKDLENMNNSEMFNDLPKVGGHVLDVGLLTPPCFSFLFWAKTAFQQPLVLEILRELPVFSLTSTQVSGFVSLPRCRKPFFISAQSTDSLVLWVILFF